MKYLAICSITALLSACSSVEIRAQVPEITREFAPIVVPALPSELIFAGESVPLDNYDTRESLMRELLTNAYLHSRTMQTLMATTRYFPVIEPIMKKYGIPDDFKYLCMAESGLNPNAGSSAGAAGLWQLMPAFAKSCGLQMGGGIDERYHLEKSTEAACRYLLDAKKRLGSWTLAAASYNVGVAGVQKRLETQGVSSYYDLFLPEETMRYVFRVLAFQLITPNAEAYGYDIPQQAYFKPLTEYRTVEVSTPSIDWSQVARTNGTSYKILRELNHWIRDYDYQNKVGKTYVLKVPEPNFRK